MPKNLALLILIFCSVFFVFSAVFAADRVSVDYTCQQFKYPWCNAADSSISGLIGRFYQIALALVGVTALGVVVFAGITYTLSAGNASKQKDSIDWITGAALGIVLLLGAYLLLYTINPNLVRLTEPDVKEIINLPPAISTSTVLSPYERTASGGQYYYERNVELASRDTNKTNWTPEEKATLYSHYEALDKLKYGAGDGNAIEVVGSGGLCPNQSSGSCTSLNGIPKKTVDTLVQIERDLANSSDPKQRELAKLITVTGGTEFGHKAQGFGYPSVDLRYNKNSAQYKQLYSYLKSNESNYGITVVSECNSGCDAYYPHITAGHMSIYTKK